MSREEEKAKLIDMIYDMQNKLRGDIYNRYLKAEAELEKACSKLINEVYLFYDEKDEEEADSETNGNAVQENDSDDKRPEQEFRREQLYRSTPHTYYEFGSHLDESVGDSLLFEDRL